MKAQQCVIRLHGSSREILSDKFPSITEAKKWVKLCWGRPYTIVKIK